MSELGFWQTLKALNLVCETDGGGPDGWCCHLATRENFLAGKDEVQAYGHTRGQARKEALRQWQEKQR